MVDGKGIMQSQAPLSLLKSWLEEARSHSGIKEAGAMVLSTCVEGQPASRIVLLKEVNDQQIQFFTNYDSRKGKALAKNPKAALTFYWDPFHRQVNIKGEVQRLTRAESEAYWKTRPRESQISGSLSRQSEVIPEGATLEQLAEKERARWQDQEVPCPPQWGGYALTPTEIEFWIGRPFRLHDRFLFSKTKEQWKCQQLFP